MEQRRLRLGDIVDDYCPRERRVTNHAIVAMVEDDIKQTRCTTCDAEHPYKGGKAPRRRKKEAPGALYKEVLAGMADAEETSPHLAAAPDEPADPADVHGAERDDEPASDVPDTAEPAPRVAASAPASEPDLDEGSDAPSGEEGPVHRRLIRATLPRPEGQKDARPLPEFTIRNSNRPNGQFRGDARMRNRGGGGGPNGNRAQGGGQRLAGARQGYGRGGGRGQGGGFRSPQQPRQGGGKKRSR
jgi:hypothetical protein